MLTMAIEEVIGKVVYCAIELDQNHFYPKEAACVVFQYRDAYIKAIAAHRVMLSFVTCERQVKKRDQNLNNKNLFRLSSNHFWRRICLVRNAEQLPGHVSAAK
jgi:hypothetical protein